MQAAVPAACWRPATGRRPRYAPRATPDAHARPRRAPIHRRRGGLVITRLRQAAPLPLLMIPALGFSRVQMDRLLALLALKFPGLVGAVLDRLGRFFAVSVLAHQRGDRPEVQGGDQGRVRRRVVRAGRQGGGRVRRGQLCRLAGRGRAGHTTACARERGALGAELLEQAVELRLEEVRRAAEQRARAAKGAQAPQARTRDEKNPVWRKRVCRDKGGRGSTARNK